MGQSKSFSVNLTYPITTVRGFPLHLERNFFGVKMVEPNISNVTDSLETDEVLTELNRITPIRYVEVRSVYIPISDTQIKELGAGDYGGGCQWRW